jgi:hypothetical protein
MGVFYVAVIVNTYKQNTLSYKIGHFTLGHEYMKELKPKLLKSKFAYPFEPILIFNSKSMI